MLVRLSVSEDANRAVNGCSVAESIVACYGHAEAARADGDVVTVDLVDVDHEAPERVAQLVGALIDADCTTVALHPTSGALADADRVALASAFERARIGADRIVWP